MSEYLITGLPPRLACREDLNELLSHMAEIDGSDLFLMSGTSIFVARHSQMVKILLRKISEGEILSIIKDFYGPQAQAKLGAGEPIDTSYDFRNKKGERFRFRVNISACERRARQGYTATFRSIPTTPPELIDVPQDIVDTCNETMQGLIAVVGATGNGKSTLLASALRFILEKEDAHRNLITLESPIEFVYDDVVMPSSFVTQMEVGRHIESFAQGVENTLRMAPKIIFVGESRNYETMSASIEASLTGHTVFTTIHANNVSETVMRMISMYPQELQTQALDKIMTSIKMVVAQRLMPKVGGGRVALREYLIFTPEIKHTILEGSNNLENTLKRIVFQSGNSMEDDAKKKFAEGIISQESLDQVVKSY